MEKRKEKKISIRPAAFFTFPKKRVTIYQERKKKSKGREKKRFF